MGKEQKRYSIAGEPRSQNGIITHVFLRYLTFAGAVLVLLVSLRLLFAIFGGESRLPEESVKVQVEAETDKGIVQETLNDPNNFAKRKDPARINPPMPSTNIAREETTNPYAPERDPMIRIKPKKTIRQVKDVEGPCADNLDVLESAKTLWYLDTDAASNVNPSWQDLVPEYLQAMPVCPSGGVYALGNSYHEATCSICGKAHNPSLYSADVSAVNGVFAKADGRYCVCPNCHAEIDKKELERSVLKGRAKCPFCNTVIK